MSLHCLFGVRDDLHAFADGVVNGLSLAQLNAPHAWTKAYGGVRAAILHREAQYQAELVIVAPGVDLPAHTHLGTDSIEYALSGCIRLHVNGAEPFGDLDDERFMAFVKGKAIRIRHDAPHGGRAHAELGAVFLSMQRWSAPPAFLGDNWQGAPIRSHGATA